MMKMMMTFDKVINSFIHPVVGYIVPPRFLYEEGFAIEYQTKVDMPLNKETKPNQTKPNQF